MRILRAFTTFLIAVAYMAAATSAQAPTATVEASDASEGRLEDRPAPDDDRARVDIRDIIRRLFGHTANDRELERPPGATAAIVPVVGAQPHVGFMAGVGAAVEFPMGPPERTPFSSVNASVTFSTEKQLGASLNATIYGADNAWRLEARNAFNQKNANDVELGTSSAASEALTLDYESTTFADTLYVRAWRRLDVGAGIIYMGQRRIEPADGRSDTSAFLSYSSRNGFNPDSQTSAGGTIALAYDGRDNANDAYAGWYLAAAFRQYLKGLWGGDSQWQELFTDVRTYRTLTEDHRHRLAFRTFGEFVTSGTAPYFSLPESAGDPDGRADRGYAEGRFRGERMIDGEIEYRGLVTRNGLIGVVSFVNMSTLTNLEQGERLFHSVAVGGGGGVRLLLSKRSRTNLCLDVGFGRNGSNGVYLGVRDAF